MIIKRIAEGIKNQDWFVVMVEVMIVVVGIFVGLQVTEWNENRKAHERATVLGERLANDFGVDAWLASNFLEYNRAVAENAKLVLDDVTKRSAATDNELLVAAYRATQFNRASVSSTYKELISTGGYELLAASELGKMATVFYESTQHGDMEHDGKTSDYRYLYRSIMPIAVQLHATEVCGDSTITVENLLNDRSTISYECELAMSESQLSEAAAILRAHPGVSDALRHRIATLSIQILDYEELVQTVDPFRATVEVLAQSAPMRAFGDLRTGGTP